KNKVGLLLGTAKFLQSGEPNLYYKYRVEAAVELLNAGKVEFILVSGDNSTKYYDEPSTFETDLIEAGIPADKMYKDYAGFRTLDSIVRSKEVFGQSSITVISQPFHNERAIYIATRKGIDAIGYNSERVIAEYGLKCRSESVWPA
ncbi:MAG: SanA protein, partial [Oceanospirillaceae bacterium]